MSRLLCFFLFAWGTVASAADAGEIAMKCGGVRHLGDAWSHAAAQRPIGDYRQPTRLDGNIVVAPLWKLTGESHLSPMARLTASLDEMKAMGVTTVYLPPLVEQTRYQFRESPNNHGYWGKTFAASSLDPKLGTKAEYDTFRAQAKAKGLKLAIDLNIRHFGYFTEEKSPFAPADGFVELFGRRVRIDDSQYFIQSPEPTTQEWQHAESAGPSAAHILTDKKVWDLPALNTANPWVREKMLEEVVKYADLGYDTYRIDAAKHLRSDYLADVIDALTARIKARGGKPRFILEYLSGNYGELAYKLSELKSKEGVYFIDFPLAGELRGVILGNNSFAAIPGALHKLSQLQLDPGHLIQAITDQDANYPPVYHGDDRSLQSVYALSVASNVLSSNRPYYVAGLEQAVARGTLRNEPAVMADRSSRAYGGIATINKYFNRNFAELVPFEPSQIVSANDGSLVVKRPFRHGGKSLLMVIERSRNSHHIREATSPFRNVKQIFRWGEYGGELEVFLGEVQ